MAVTREARPLARVTLWLGLGLYLLALAVSPLLHHDLECHFKTPSHCDACMASPPGISAAAEAPLDPADLHDAGRLEAVRATAPQPMFAVDTPGRSPPA